MTADHQTSIVTKSAAETERVAASIGSRLRGGEIIELFSDLGGGKTTFTRGLAMGAGSNDRVASPTFTISKIYNAEALEIHHFDLYRLGHAGLIEHELQDILGEPNIVTVIEWGEVVQHVLPSERLTIKIARTGDEERELVFYYPGVLSYLVENL